MSPQTIEPLTFEETLRELRAHVARQLPREMHERLSAAIDDLVRADPGANALRVGQRAPDFALPDFDGRTVTLSERLRAGPVIVTFYRGSWCPYCDLALRAYANMLPRLQRTDAQLLALSPQRADAVAPNAVEQRGLGFPLLIDAGNRVAGAYGLAYDVGVPMRAVLADFGLDLAAINGSREWELPVPATFIVSPDSRIVWAHVESDFREPARPDDILRALGAL